MCWEREANCSATSALGERTRFWTLTASNLWPSDARAFQCSPGVLYLDFQAFSDTNVVSLLRLTIGLE
jgi:hypothetical protein